MAEIVSKCLEFRRNGNPLEAQKAFFLSSLWPDKEKEEVLQIGQRLVDASKLAANEALIRWLAGPVNPLDINRISGTYAFKVPLPALGGCEGVGVIEKVGTSGGKLAVGDRVVSFRVQDGVWTQFAVVNTEYLIKLDQRVDLATAATLSINPPTAFVILTRFGNLVAGDFVIQNAANSGVGRAVIQIGKYLGIRTINLVRDRGDLDALKRDLYELGADFVFSESEFTPAFAKKFLREQAARVKLALNGVGGRSALIVSSALDQGGTMVTYGGMSKRPSEIATSALVYRDIRAVGVTVWPFLHDDANLDEVTGMFNELQRMIISGNLRGPPTRFYAFNEYRDAIRAAMPASGGTSSTAKPIILLQNADSEHYAELKMNKSKI